MQERTLRNVEYLFDLLDGLDVVSRREPSASGPGLGWEPCLGCRENKPRWGGVCPACAGLGLVRSRTGEHDPYVKGDATSIKSEGQPSSFRPDADAWVHLTPTERAAFVRLRLGRVLARLVRLIARAPETVREGIPDRSQESMTWFAKRLPYIPNVVH